MKRFIIFLAAVVLLVSVAGTPSFAFDRRSYGNYRDNYQCGRRNVFTGVITTERCPRCCNNLTPAYNATASRCSSSYNKAYELEMDRLQQEEYREQQRLQAEQERLQQERAREDARRDFYSGRRGYRR